MDNNIIIYFSILIENQIFKGQITPVFGLIIYPINQF